MIGIICAMQIEADGILALCENKEETVKYGMTFTRGTLCGKELVVVVCGIGKVNAAMCATTLINDYQPSLVMNSGVAGALSPVVSIGDIVVGTKAVEHDMNTTALGDKQGEVSFPTGRRFAPAWRTPRPCAASLPAAMFLSPTVPSANCSTTASARLHAKWRAPPSVMSASAAAYPM